MTTTSLESMYQLEFSGLRRVGKSEEENRKGSTVSSDVVIFSL